MKILVRQFAEKCGNPDPNIYLNNMKDAYHATDFSLTIEDRIRAYLKSVCSDPQYDGFEATILRQVSFAKIQQNPAHIEYSFEVQEFMCNKDGNLHGGAIATVFDNLSSTALYTINSPDFWSNLGVSRSINVIYHRAIPLGGEVKLVCRVVSAGKKMATVSAVMESQEGKVLASCIHEKFSVEHSRL